MVFFWYFKINFCFIFLIFILIY